MSIIAASGSKLEELKLAEGNIFIFCYNNNIKYLNVPESCFELYCYNNKITELNLPVSIGKVECDLLQVINYEWCEELELTIFL